MIPEDLARARRIVESLEAEPFDVQMATLEVALAIVLLRATAEGSHPHFLRIGAGLIHNHLLDLLEPGVIPNG
jgi:hypothetical protein